jgi:hypothetical protein
MAVYVLFIYGRMYYVALWPWKPLFVFVRYPTEKSQLRPDIEIRRIIEQTIASQALITANWNLVGADTIFNKSNLKM